MDSLIALREHAQHLVSASFQEKGETEDGLVFDVGTRETGSPSYDSQGVGRFIDSTVRETGLRLRCGAVHFKEIRNADSFTHFQGQCKQQESILGFSISLLVGKKWIPATLMGLCCGVIASLPSPTLICRNPALQPWYRDFRSWGTVVSSWVWTTLTNAASDVRVLRVKAQEGVTWGGGALTRQTLQCSDPIASRQEVE